MGPFENALLGFLFLALAAAATFLMYHMWGYPFDHATLKSEAPPRLMRLHRVLGWLFLAVYVVLMIQMIPRLWGYQIELPARTVAHLILGMAIGAVLLVKVVIVRYAKHLESSMAPTLGTVLLVATVLLIGLSAPMAVREAVASARELNQPGNLERVKGQLDLAGLTDARARARLATADGLAQGRRVLASRCVSCHDLRTVLARPRTPEDWRDTVRRMAGRTARISPLEEPEQWQVTAYLIAISPDLQASVSRQREQEQARQSSEAAAGTPAVPAADYDAAGAKGLFDRKCGQCHPAALIEASRIASADDARGLVSRMVRNGLRLEQGEAETLTRYITELRLKQ